ncbi:MAG: hypothetical protein ACREAF_03100 [Nitrosopumilaceae archaeon]
MALSQVTKDFVESLVDYYISVASSYKQFAETYAVDATDISATTFGIIVGCVYSGFLQSYANQKQKASLDDIQEFNQIIKRRAPQIKKAILEAKP